MASNTPRMGPASVVSGIVGRERVTSCQGEHGLLNYPPTDCRPAG